MRRKVTHRLTATDARGARATSYFDLGDLPVGGSRTVLTVGGEEFTVQRDADAGGRRRYAAREMGATLEESDGLERAQAARGKR